jgi:hypothetical protein
VGEVSLLLITQQTIDSAISVMLLLVVNLALLHLVSIELQGQDCSPFILGDLPHDQVGTIGRARSPREAAV